MSQVVIAYAEPDASFANDLKQVLADSGFEATNGAQVREPLALVAVLSAESNLLPELSYQWAFAIGSGVPVLPALLNIGEEDLHPRLNALQHLDFSDSSDPPWESLIEALRRLEARQQSVTLRVPLSAPMAVQLAAQTLDDADPSARAAALDTLEDMDHPAALELLAQALRHPVDQVRSGAVKELASRSDLRAFPVLLERIRSGDEEVKPWMLAMGSAAIPLLREALWDEDESVCSFAALALGIVGGPDAAVALIASLERDGSAKRDWVVPALGDTKDASAIPTLMTFVQDPDREVRCSAVEGLVKCGSKAEALSSLIPILATALNDQYDQVAIKACKGLELSKDPLAIPILLRGAIGKDDQVRNFCRSAIRDLGVDGSPLLREMAKDCSEDELRHIYYMLSGSTDVANVPLFLEGAKHADEEIRTSSINGIDRTRSREGVPTLLDCLEDEEVFVRDRSLAALGEISDPASVARLIPYLADEEIGPSVADILAKIATKEARRALRSWKNQAKN